MRRDSLTILVISVVLTAGIVGTAHYLYLQNQKAPSSPVATQPQSKTDVAPTSRRTAQTPTRRTATPIKCTQANGSIFWTNASRCRDADLNNRLSYADPVKPIPRIKTKDKNRKSRNSSQASASHKQSMKLIPQKMPVACSFPIGMARKIETRSLSLKADPKESIWKSSYCGWVCEARVENCGNLNEYLKLVGLCPQRSNMSKRACRT